MNPRIFFPVPTGILHDLPGIPMGNGSFIIRLCFHIRRGMDRQADRYPGCIHHCN
jgi:hypothetical protein